VALCGSVFGPTANAQTVLTMTNGGAESGPTFLNVSNLASASTLGGLSAGAVSVMDQGGFNQLNAVGVVASMPLLPVPLSFGPSFSSGAIQFGGTGSVSINMLAGGLVTSNSVGFTIPAAPAAGPMSLSVVNSNIAASTGPSLSSGGNPAAAGVVFFGPSPSSTLVGGSQIGINQISAFGP